MGKDTGHRVVRRAAGVLAVGGLVLAPLAGCSAGDGETGSQPATTEAAAPVRPTPVGDPTPQATPANGGAWVATRITEGGTPRRLDEYTYVHVTLDPADTVHGELTAGAGCAEWTVPYSLDGSTITIGGPLAWTGSPCEENLDQELWLAETLTGDATWTLDGTSLELSVGEVHLQMTDDRVMDPRDEVTARQWSVDTVVHDGVSLAPIEGLLAMVALSPDGSSAIVVACRMAEVTFGSELNTDDDGTPLPDLLEFDQPGPFVDVAPEQMGAAGGDCRDRAADPAGDGEITATDLEGVLADLFHGSLQAAVSGDRMSLISADGETGATFTAA